MSTDQRRAAAGLVIAVCSIALVTVAVIAAEAPAYVRWSHVLVIVAAAVTFLLGAVAYLYGIRHAEPDRDPEAYGPELVTAYYLNMAAWKQPVVFAGRPS